MPLTHASMDRFAPHRRRWLRARRVRGAVEEKFVGAAAAASGEDGRRGRRGCGSNRYGSNRYVMMARGPFPASRSHGFSVVARPPRVHAHHACMHTTRVHAHHACMPFPPQTTTSRCRWQRRHTPRQHPRDTCSRARQQRAWRPEATWRARHRRRRRCRRRRSRAVWRAAARRVWRSGGSRGIRTWGGVWRGRFQRGAAKRLRSSVPSRVGCLRMAVRARWLLARA